MAWRGAGGRTDRQTDGRTDSGQQPSVGGAIMVAVAAGRNWAGQVLVRVWRAITHLPTSSALASHITLSASRRAIVSKGAPIKYSVRRSTLPDRRRRVTLFSTAVSVTSSTFHSTQQAQIVSSTRHQLMNDSTAIVCDLHAARIISPVRRLTLRRSVEH